MPMKDDDDYSYLPLGGGKRKGGRRLPEKLHVLLAFFGGMVCFFIAMKLWSMRGFQALPSALENYQPLHKLSMIHSPPIRGNVGPNQRAVVTSLYTEDYVYALATLGHSLIAAGVTSRRIVIYIPDRISERALCIVRAAGWEPKPVEIINAPHGGKGVHWSFIDQYTKLSIWTLDQEGITTAIYLDADTLVRKNFDELWDLPFEFAAVPDIYVGDAGFTIGFNAGVMLFHPSTDLFKTMVAKMESAKFELRDAEQAFMNLFFGVEAVRLPYAYGGNLAIKERSREMWENLQRDLAVVHYTLVKPFEPHVKCGWFSSCPKDTVWDEQRRLNYIQTAKKKWSGNFETEVGWWETEYHEAMKALGTQCPA